MATRFHVRPAGEDRAEVTIAAELQGLGVVEGFIARLMLQKVYREELDLLARLAREEHPATHTASTDTARP